VVKEIQQQQQQQQPSVVVCRLPLALSAPNWGSREGSIEGASGAGAPAVSSEWVDFTLRLVISARAAASAVKSRGDVETLCGLQGIRVTLCCFSTSSTTKSCFKQYWVEDSFTNGRMQ
jgi:hypothetical protein